MLNGLGALRYLLLFFCLIAAVPAFADPGGDGRVAVDMRISAVIVQCGTREDARKQCESGDEKRCCAFFDGYKPEQQNSLVANLGDLQQTGFGPEYFAGDMPGSGLE